MVPLPCTLAFVGYLFFSIAFLRRIVLTENLISWIHILSKNEATVNMVPSNADLIVWAFPTFVVLKKGGVNTIYCDPGGTIWYETSFFESDTTYAASWYVL